MPSHESSDRPGRNVHPQLQSIADDFERAQDRLHRLVSTVPEDLWGKRPDPTRWSMMECIAHLNLASAAYLPLLSAGISEARALNGPTPQRYRRDPVGWLLWRMMSPPVRIRTKTPAAFVPTGARSRSELVHEFEELQGEQVRCVEQADGLPLGRVRITSPFDARVKYNLFACLSMLPRHQHRHLWQAEQIPRQIIQAGSK